MTTSQLKIMKSKWISQLSEAKMTIFIKIISEHPDATTKDLIQFINDCNVCELTLGQVFLNEGISTTAKKASNPKRRKRNEKSSKTWTSERVKSLFKLLTKDQKSFCISVAVGQDITVAEFSKRFEYRSCGISKRFKGIVSISTKMDPSLPCPIWIAGDKGEKTIQMNREMADSIYEIDDEWLPMQSNVGSDAIQFTDDGLRVLSLKERIHSFFLKNPGLKTTALELATETGIHSVQINQVLSRGAKSTPPIYERTSPGVYRLADSKIQS